MTLLQLAFILLATGAVGGLSLAVMVALGIRFPAWFGAGHGLLNLVGLAVLFASNLHDGDAVVDARWWGLGILTAALAGGLIFFRAIYPERIPLAAAAVHGAAAAVGLWVLAPTVGLA